MNATPYLFFKLSKNGFARKLFLRHGRLELTLVVNTASRYYCSTMFIAS